MFDLCKKVHVYNIENHYHYYYDANTTPKNKQKMHFNKLKPLPISVINAKKKTSEDSDRRGLQLTKTISCEIERNQIREDYQTKIHANLIKNQPLINKISKDPKQLLVSTKESEGSKLKVYSITFPEPINLIESKNTHSLKPPSARGRGASCQSLKQKKKPKLQSKTKNVETLSFGNKKLVDTTCSGAYYQQFIQHMSPNQQKKQEMLRYSQKDKIHEIQIRSQQEDISFVFQDPVSFEGNSPTFFDHEYTFKNLNETSKNNDSKSTTYKIGHIPVNSFQPSFNKLDSSIKPKKILTTPNSASIILSQILSKESSRIEFNNFLTVQPNRVVKELKDLDRMTIKSYDADYSEFSVQVEQSFICEHNPCNYFTEIKKERKHNYGLTFALENSVGFGVTLKQMDFSCMLNIAEQIKVYTSIDEDKNKELYICHILELLQVQLTNSSYILIKQPYQKSLRRHLKDLIDYKQEKKVDLLKNEIEQSIKTLVHGLSCINFHPIGLLSVDDFVVCLQTPILQNLQVFHHVDAISESVRVETAISIVQNIFQEIEHLCFSDSQ